MSDNRKRGPFTDDSRIERPAGRGYENPPKGDDKKKSSPNLPNTASRVAGILGRK